MVTIPPKQAPPASRSALTLEPGPRKEPERPQSLSAVPRLLALFLLAMLWHWLLSFSQLWWKEQLQPLAFVTPRNIAVGWEASPGKKAPAMSFLAYYKESKIYQIENSYYYRDMLTKRNSIKLPQNTKYPAQRAAFIHLLRAYVGAEICSVSHKHSVPLLLQGTSTGSRCQWAGEALTHPKGPGHPACPQPALSLQTQTLSVIPAFCPNVRTLCASQRRKKQGTPHCSPNANTVPV